MSVGYLLMLRLWPLRLLWNFCMCSTTAVPRVGLLRLSGSMYSSDGARCTRCRRFVLPGSMKPGVVSGVWQISEMPHIHHHSRASSSEPQPGHLIILGTLVGMFGRLATVMRLPLNCQATLLPFERNGTPLGTTVLYSRQRHSTTTNISNSSSHPRGIPL